MDTAMLVPFARSCVRKQLNSPPHLNSFSFLVISGDVQCHDDKSLPSAIYTAGPGNAPAAKVFRPSYPAVTAPGEIFFKVDSKTRYFSHSHLFSSSFWVCGKALRFVQVCVRLQCHALETSNKPNIGVSLP